ncbi:MAG: preprotein translocase subunit YajC [Flavobacteriales bacterium]|nr:preprotein translocase subunit YajC [Flavobacteriales bacterium]
MILLQAAGGGFGGFLPVLLIIVVFYFFMIRPQMKRQKDEKNFRSEIRKGQRVVTNGGMHGKITEMTDTTITLEVQNGIKIKMEKASISKELSAQYIKSEEGKSSKKDKAETKKVEEKKETES